MNCKYWIKFILIISFVMFIVVVCFNYIVNPYNVFSHTFLSKQLNVKDNVISDEMSKFYAAKRSNPDVLLIGSSRTEHLNPNDLKPYVQGKIFNLGVKGSGLSTQYNMIRYFIEKQNVKTIIWGLDFYAFSPYNIRNTDIKGTRYNEEFFEDYKSALLSFRTLRKSIKTVKDNLKNKLPKMNWNNGWDTYVYEYKEIKKNGPQWHLDRIESSFPNFGLDKHFFMYEKFKEPNSINKGLTILSNVIELCQNNRVKLKLFTTPIYHRIYDVINDRGYSKTYKYWKEQLLSSYDIVDFNNKNEITKNYKNYIEASHFQSKVGIFIFRELFKEERN